MTELEKMQRAKMYIDKLANGIDPITDQEMPEDTVLNNVRLMRCFFYVGDILRQVIENGGEVKKSAGKSPQEQFHITQEEVSSIVIPDDTVPISGFCGLINNAVNSSGSMKNLSHTTITSWLVKNNYLRDDIIGGKTRRRAGAKASQIGIFEEKRTTYDGKDYIAVLYSPQAQRFILDNLIDIINS